MHNLAGAYTDAGQMDKAIALAAQTLEKLRVKLGSDHPYTMISMHDLAGAYDKAGKLDRSIPLYEETFRLEKEKLGPNQFETIATQANLAKSYCVAGRLEDAIPLLEDALLKVATLPPHQAARLAWIRATLTVAYEQTGRYVKAEPLRRAFVSQARQQWGAEDWRTAGQMTGLGMNLLRQKKYAEAESVLRESLAICDKSQRPDWGIFYTRSMLGGCLLHQKMYAEAEPLLLAGYRGMKERQAEIPPQAKGSLAEALEQLVQLYTGWDKKDEATRWRREWEARQQAQQSSSEKTRP
jgi:tetratricopeptide (TPR) repeat protein